MGSAGGGTANLLPNNGRVIQSGGARILCVADVRGMYCLWLSRLKA